MDADGHVVASYAYDAFGNTVSESGSMSSAFPFRFSTKYYDSESGLYYYGYRFYSPKLGRWLTRDPIEEAGGVNLYGFCGNDGVGKVDVLGLRADFGLKICMVVSPTIRGGMEFALMLIGSARWDACDWITFNADIGLNLLSGGIIGTPRDANRMYCELFANVSGTAGRGEGKGLPFSSNGCQWVSVLEDKYRSSASFGQTWYYSQALGEGVRMTSLRLQFDDSAFINYSNDIRNPSRLGFGDGGDRGWTGGGMLGFGIGNGQTITLSFDDFSGRTAKNGIHPFNPSEPNEQSVPSQSLNQAQWSLSIMGLDGLDCGLTVDSPDALNVQHWIHSTISPDAGYFQYPPSPDLRIRLKGSIGGKQ